MALSLDEIEKRVSDSYELPNNVLNAIPDPIVTVRTSTYQHGCYIRECIEGVLMQKTDFPFEFIIGEDFSTDGTREIVFEYAKKFPDIIRVITADYNVGAKANGRRTLIESRGKYIALCEGDDYWIDPLKLQKQIGFLQNHESYVLSHTNCDSFIVHHDKTEKSLNSDYSKMNITTKERRFFALIDGSLKIRTGSAVYRKKYLNEFQKDKKFIMGDTPLWLNLSQKGRFHYLNESTMVYRIHHGSMSRPKKRKKRVAFKLSGIQMRLYYLDKYEYKVPDWLIKKYENLMTEYALLGGQICPSEHDYGIIENADKIKRIKCRSQIINYLIYYFDNPYFLVYDIYSKFIKV